MGLVPNVPLKKMPLIDKAFNRVAIDLVEPMTVHQVKKGTGSFRQLLIL